MFRLLTVQFPGGQVQQAFDASHLPNDITIAYPRVIKAFALIELDSILRGEQVIPGANLRSWLDVLALLEISKQIGVTDNVLAKAFANFGSDTSALKMTGSEHMFQCYALLPETVNFDKLFRTIDSAVSIIKQNLTEYPYDVRLRQFVASYDILKAFPKAETRAVKQKIEKLKTELAALGDSLLVATPEDVRVIAYEGPSHSCKGFTQANTPLAGELAFVAHDEILRRFHAATYDMFKDRDGKKFPSGVVFSGGLYARLLSPTFDLKHARGTDIDIFPVGKDFAERERLFKEILQWFASSKTYYAVLRSVVTVYVLDIPRKFQIVSTNSSTVAQVIQGFDLSHVQHALTFAEPGLQSPRFWSTPAGVETQRTRVATLHPTVRTNAKRCYKALRMGYNVDASPNAIEICDISAMVAQPTEEPAKSYARELTTYYLPRSDPELSIQELTEFVLANVQKDSNADSATTDPNVVLQTAQIGSNFRGNYDMRMFSTFDKNTVKPANNNHRNFQTFMCDNRGKRIFMQSSPAKVKSFAADADSLTITLAVEQKFGEFLQTLQTDVFRLYRQGGVTKNFIVDGTYTLKINRTFVNSLVRKGSSILRNQRGRPLDVDEDLIEGATVAFVFTTQFVVQGDERYITLSPLSLIKHEDSTTTTSDDSDDAAENLEDIAEMPEATFAY
jgi:hypothetical protein